MGLPAPSTDHAPGSAKHRQGTRNNLTSGSARGRTPHGDEVLHPQAKAASKADGDGGQHAGSGPCAASGRRRQRKKEHPPAWSRGDTAQGSPAPREGGCRGASVSRRARRGAGPGGRSVCVGEGEGTLRPAAVTSGEQGGRGGAGPRERARHERARARLRGASLGRGGEGAEAKAGMRPRPGGMQMRVGRCTCAKSSRGPGAPRGVGGSVVLLGLLPSGHPEFLAAAGPVPLLLPDPHRLVLGHDPVVAGPLEEVALGGEGRGSGGCRGRAGRRRDPQGDGEQRERQHGAPAPYGEPAGSRRSRGSEEEEKRLEKRLERRLPLQPGPAGHYQGGARAPGGQRGRPR